MLDLFLQFFRRFNPQWMIVSIVMGMYPPAALAQVTGTVSLDRSDYPVPFGIPADFATSSSSTPSGRSIFPVHQTAVSGGATVGIDAAEFIPGGNLTVHISVNDPDFDTTSGMDSIAQNVSGTAHGPVKIFIQRGIQRVILGYAGGPTTEFGVIDVDDNSPDTAPQFGGMTETEPNSGIFEFALTILYTDGPADQSCPETTSFDSLDGTAGTTQLNRFDLVSPFTQSYCILRNDLLIVEYTDPMDATGSVRLVNDSASFALRTGALQTDKSVYIIGNDIILTLIEPDLNLDSALTDIFDIDLIEWNSDPARITIGDLGGQAVAFDTVSELLVESAPNSGIFHTQVLVPWLLQNNPIDRGDQIIFEYTDWGPSGFDYVGEGDQNVNVSIFSSNFGATVELDQKVYSWTDKVFVTIVAPDWNFNDTAFDVIGNTVFNPIKIATRSFDLDFYTLEESGMDTGIFTGEVILTGFQHDADGDFTTGDASGFDTNPRTSGAGPNDGFLEADNDDGITVSFEYSTDQFVVGSSFIRWNMGETQWLEMSYPTTGTGVVRVIDPDMNLNPNFVDSFDIDVWSDSDLGGIDLAVTETNAATGIFEGTVFFTTTNQSVGSQLRVAKGDFVTADYEDHTLPDPFTVNDDQSIRATTIVLEESLQLSNIRIVNAFGDTVTNPTVNQQVQIKANLTNNEAVEQTYAFVVEIRDDTNVVVSNSWLSGRINPGQSNSPALSWKPTVAGTYTATIIVRESLDNTTGLLNPPSFISITVL